MIFWPARFLTYTGSMCAAALAISGVLGFLDCLLFSNCGGFNG